MVSWTTPTVALAIKINKMTKGSTKAVIQLPPGSEASSNRARTNETTAEPSRIKTSWSLNWANIRVKSEVAGGSGRATSQLVYTLDGEMGHTVLAI